MKLSDYLDLQMTVTPTVRKEYLEHTIVIEYKDGEIAKIENECGEPTFLSKRSLKDFIDDETGGLDLDREGKYLSDSFDKDETLTQIFQKVNPSIKQVWIAPY